MRRFSVSPYGPARGNAGLLFLPVVGRQPVERQAQTMLSGPLPPVSGFVRRRSGADQRAHNSRVAGSSPAAATSLQSRPRGQTLASGQPDAGVGNPPVLSRGRDCVSFLPASQRSGAISAARPCGRAVALPTTAGTFISVGRNAWRARVLSGPHNRRPGFPLLRKGSVGRFLLLSVVKLCFLPMARAAFCVEMIRSRRAQRLAAWQAGAPQLARLH